MDSPLETAKQMSPPSPERPREPADDSGSQRLGGDQDLGIARGAAREGGVGGVQVDSGLVPRADGDQRSLGGGAGGEVEALDGVSAGWPCFTGLLIEKCHYWPALGRAVQLVNEQWVRQIEVVRAMGGLICYPHFLEDHSHEDN